MDTNPATTPDAESVMRDVLGRLAGPEAVPRDDQVEAVAAVLQPHARVLVVQATGWGKSAVYWAATTALRAAGRGPTLVVSPLLALMRDQVTAAERAGLRAATVNSTNFDEWDRVFEALDADELDVLLVSPERLGNARFAARLDDLLARIGLVVIDEAHCISDWGFDFRPDYQRLARALLATPTASVLATTATANQRVTADVEAQLGTGAITFRGTLARTSLRLSVVPGLSALERYAWVADALDHLPGSGIVYVLTVAEADRLAGYLRSVGHDVAPYTGQLDADTRQRVEDQLRDNRVKAVVATSALGMGYDKPDLGFCLHVGSPSTPVAYYQQVGRAGRAVSHADAVLLSADSDERIWEYFATASIPDPDHVTAVLDALGEGPASIPDLEQRTGVRRGRLDALTKLLAVDGVLAKEGTTWRSTGTEYVHDHDKWDQLAATRRAEADLMRAYAHGRGCLMQFLQRALDDPDPTPCGRCSVCTGEVPHPGERPSEERIAAASAFLRGEDHVIEPRKRWPGGVGKRGGIIGIAEGRAVAFADDPAWVRELADLRRVLATNPDDGSAAPAVPDALVHGAVETLRRWSSSWSRPRVVVPAPAHGVEAAMNRHLARELGRIGKLPVLDGFVWSGGPPPDDAASAPMVEHLLGAIAWQPDDGQASGPVLLCATTMRTGWTLTVAASLLHDAGLGPSLPLVVHRLP